MSTKLAKKRKKNAKKNVNKKLQKNGSLVFENSKLFFHFEYLKSELQMHIRENYQIKIKNQFSCFGFGFD